MAFAWLATNWARSFLAQLPASEAGCILLDLRMPGLSGPDLQDRLAQAAPLLPIVFLTGQGTIAASVQAMKAGADDFLEKPVSSKILREAIERALDQNEKRRAGHEQIQLLQTECQISRRAKLRFSILSFAASATSRLPTT